MYVRNRRKQISIAVAGGPREKGYAEEQNGVNHARRWHGQVDEPLKGF